MVKNIEDYYLNVPARESYDTVHGLFQAGSW